MFTLSVEIYDTQGVADIPADQQKTPLPSIGKHQAFQSTGVAGGCFAVIPVTDSSRVDFQAVGGSDAKACQLAVQLAQLVEPKLP